MIGPSKMDWSILNIWLILQSGSRGWCNIWIPWRSRTPGPGVRLVSESVAWFGDVERLERKKHTEIRGPTSTLLFNVPATKEGFTLLMKHKHMKRWNTPGDSTSPRVWSGEFDGRELPLASLWWVVRGYCGTIRRTPKNNDSTKFRLNFHLPKLSGRWEVSSGVSYLHRYCKILSISKSLQQAKANVVVMA